jgi:DNA-binding transcriptional MerR regulator
MKKYGMSEVCALLGVKPHVIRYWEQEIPFLSPEKSITGRRIFHDHDVQILLRLKHLLYEKKFTIEGARNKIFQELNSDRLDVKTTIHRIRSDLIEILSKINEKKTSTDK